MRIGWQVVHNQNLYTLMGFDNGKLEIYSDYLYENKLVLPQSVRHFFIQMGDLITFYAKNVRGEYMTDNVEWIVLDIVAKKTGIIIVVESGEDGLKCELTLLEMQKSTYTIK